MFSTSLPMLHLFALLLGFFHVLGLAEAALYVVTPSDRSTCAGGQPCTVTWLDDGRAPLLSAIGVSTVGLYTGTRKIVQALPPVDVSQTLSFTFTPDPAAGPNSGAYYIAFTSTEALNGTEPFSFYSPWFRLAGMKGSFDSPIPSLTSDKPVPTTAPETSTSTEKLSTITVGTLSTSFTDGLTITLPTPTPSPSTSSSASSSSSSSGFSTSRASATSPASASTTALENAASLTTRRGMGVSLCLAVVVCWALAF